MARATGSLATVLVLACLGPAAAARQRGELAAALERALSAKDYGLAYTLLHRARRRNPDDPRFDRALGRVCLLLADSQERAGEPSRALDSLREAASLLPGEAAPWLRLGAVLETLGRRAEARRHWKRAVEAVPDAPEVLREAAAALLRSGRLRDALPLLERAARAGDTASARALRRTRIDLAIEARYAALAGRGLRLHAPAEGGGGLRRARALLAKLERARGTVAARLGFEPAHPILVVAYPAGDFARLAHPSTWAGAWFDGRVRLPLAGWRGDRALLLALARHEFTHAFLSARLPGLSPWLHEGLAQWLEGIRPAESRAALAAGPVPSTARLRADFVGVEDKGAAARLYAASHLIVLELLEAEGTDGLRRLLDRLARLGAAAEDKALRAVYGRDLAALRRRLAGER